jgi:hypothetical protein
MNILHSTILAIIIGCFVTTLQRREHPLCQAE